MRTIAVILVSTSLDRGAHAPCPAAAGFAPPSPRTISGNGTPLNGYAKKSFGEVPNAAREARALPSDLFWTWFIDNPRPLSIGH